MSGRVQKLRRDGTAPVNTPGDDITSVQVKSPRVDGVELPTLITSQERRGEVDARPTGKRRRKLGPARAEAKARTRESILDAACALFSEEGFDQPGLDTICSVAGRTRGAYNVHFRSREDLITTVALRAVEQLERRVCGAAGDGSERDLCQCLLERADEDQLPLTLLLHAVSRYPAVRDGYLAALERMTQQLSSAAQEQVAAGKTRADVAPRQAALMLTALLTGLDALEDVGLGMSQGADIEASMSDAPRREQLVELLSALMTRPG